MHISNQQIHWGTTCFSHTPTSSNALQAMDIDICVSNNTLWTTAVNELSVIPVSPCSKPVQSTLIPDYHPGLLRRYLNGSYL